MSNRARLAWVMHMRHAHPRGRCSLVRVQSDRFTVTTVNYKTPNGDTVGYKTPHGDRLASPKRFNSFRHDHGCCGSTISDAGPLSLLTLSTGKGSLWVKSTPDQSNGVPGGLSPWKRMLFSAVLSNRQSCSPAARISSNVTRIAIRHHGYESVVGTPLQRMLDQSEAGRGGEIKATSKPAPAWRAQN